MFGSFNTTFWSLIYACCKIDQNLEYVFDSNVFFSRMKMSQWFGMKENVTLTFEIKLEISHSEHFMDFGMKKGTLIYSNLKFWNVKLLNCIVLIADKGATALDCACSGRIWR